ncbi:MAG TPA: hypothetical protein VMT64_05575 [Candidatus Binataceae bacterium]|nr:hypothetical protein [Candidatus Binataceae bacterium]
MHSISARVRAVILAMLMSALASALLFSPMRVRAATLAGASCTIGGADIEVSFEPGELALSRGTVFDWIAESASAVTEYYGEFPVRRLKVVVVPLDHGEGVVFGRTFVPGPTPVIRVMLGRVITNEDLRADWIMTHEMVHLAFPSVAREHHWIEEGIATYVEPIARAQIGDLVARKVWRDMLDGMPHGLPAAGDRGLDHTHTWGRTYWGGALFCLLADVEIHRRTDNRFGFQDALRAIMRDGNMMTDKPLAHALKVGDDAVGVPVLAELYNQMKDAPMDPHLDELWKRLGVKVAGDSVAFDASAPEAAIVTSIMKPRAGKPIASPWRSSKE